MKKFIQFILFITFMMLINLIGHLTGVLFIEEYSKWEHFDFFYSLFFISIYSVFQIFVFSVNKKYKCFIIPIFTLLLFSFILYDDPSGYGGEVIYITVTETSKIIQLFTHIGYSINDDLIRFNYMNLLHSLGYSVYLLIVFLSFKYILKHLTSICRKKGFNIVLKNDEL